MKLLTRAHTLITLCVLALNPLTVFGVSMDRLDSVFLVPYATYSGNGQTTIAGLTVASGEGTVYWTFFDAAGDRHLDGEFSVTNVEKVNFIWSNIALRGGINFADTPGFLLFGYDSNGDQRVTPSDTGLLSVQAFLFSPSTDDVAFLPALRINENQLDTDDPDDWSTSPIKELFNTDAPNSTNADVGIRFFHDGVPNNSERTQIVIFTTGSPGSTQDAQVFSLRANNSENIEFSTPNRHLNILDSEKIGDFSDDIFDGLIAWKIGSGTNNTFSAYVFSIIDSSAFGAIQTLMGTFADGR